MTEETSRSRNQKELEIKKSVLNLSQLTYYLFPRGGAVAELPKTEWAKRAILGSLPRLGFDTKDTSDCREVMIAHSDFTKEPITVENITKADSLRFSEQGVQRLLTHKVSALTLNGVNGQSWSNSV